MINDLENKFFKFSAQLLLFLFFNAFTNLKNQCDWNQRCLFLTVIFVMNN